MKFIYRFGFITICMIMALSFSNSLYAQYCAASTTYYDEYIGYVKFNTIEHDEDSQSTTVADYSSISTSVFAGSSYDITVMNNYGNTYSTDVVSVWIDFNQDYTFSTSNEQFNLSSADGGVTYTGTIKIPSTSSFGSCRMRVRMMYNTTCVPCGSSSYGEVEDYTVIVMPPPPDASITDVTSPIPPFPVGNYVVKAILKSNNDIPLTNAKIDWYVNNVKQGSTINWTGSLPKGFTQELTLGLYSFTYPDGSNFNPFIVKVVVSSANGFAADENPANDAFSKSIAPTLNDCGAIGLFGPPEGFGPGVTQVRARVKNYAPKPLSKVTVNWKIDGQLQTPVSFTGLSVKNGEFVDLNVGTYLFYNKTPLGPFTVECWTTLPNAVTDEDASNDKYTGGIGPSLVAGTYKIGGYQAHFQTPADAVSYLNSSGVFGSGTVNLDIRPGTYTGQLLLSSALANNNQVVFHSESGRNYEVIIDSKPTQSNNFVVQVYNMKNVQFRDLTINNNNSNTSFAGRVFDCANSDGLVISNCTINGVANAPKDNNYSTIVLKNAGIDVSKNIFNYGSIAVDVQSTGTAPTSISDNNFVNFSWSGAKVASGGITSTLITNNTIKSEGTGTPNYGVWLEGPAIVSGNIFSGINGTGSVSEGVIKVIQTYPTQALMVSIIGNTITNCSNINGLRAENAYLFVNKNYFNMTQTLNNQNALVNLVNCQGYIGNNNLIGSNIYGIMAQNLSGLYVIYNSILLNSGSQSIIRSISADVNVMRNIFLNKGTGLIYEVTGGKPVFKDNTFKSVSTNFASANGSSYSVLATWLNAGFDSGSQITNVTFKSSSDLQIGLYTPEILYYVPLYPGDKGLAGIIEGTDYNGESRSSYFAGSDEIFLKITLARQSDGFIDCEKSDVNSLFVGAEINYGAKMTYQWSKDGSDLVGETNPVLYFPSLAFAQSGIYKCKINGPGTTPAVYSKPVAVYVATPTVITEQPANVIKPLGDLATFSFDASVNGKKVADAIITDEVKVQWYKYESDTKSTLLTDAMPRISGSKSNYLTIKNFTSADLGKYYAQVIGLCGTVKTVNAQLIEEVLDITILKQPVSTTICEGTDVVFSVDATTQSAKTIKYQWFNNTASITNVTGAIDGATGRQLSIFGVKSIDAGQYHCEVSLEGTSVMKQTDTVNLNINTKPVILTEPENTSILSGAQLQLEVILENPSETGLVYQWYKDNKIIKNATASIYMKDKADITDAGEYWCAITMAAEQQIQLK